MCQNDCYGLILFGLEGNESVVDRFYGIPGQASHKYAHIFLYYQEVDGRVGKNESEGFFYNSWTSTSLTDVNRVMQNASHLTQQTGQFPGCFCGEGRDIKSEPSTGIAG